MTDVRGGLIIVSPTSRGDGPPGIAFMRESLSESPPRASVRVPARRESPRLVRVMGAEIWVKVDGPPTVDPDADLRFLGLDTRTPYVARSTAVPMAANPPTIPARRDWVNAAGDEGPWSETLTVTISA
jgi:hypothetical protein